MSTFIVAFIILMLVGGAFIAVLAAMAWVG